MKLFDLEITASNSIQWREWYLFQSPALEPCNEGEAGRQSQWSFIAPRKFPAEAPKQQKKTQRGFRCRGISVRTLPTTLQINKTWCYLTWLDYEDSKTVLWFSYKCLFAADNDRSAPIGSHAIEGCLYFFILLLCCTMTEDKGLFLFLKLTSATCSDAITHRTSGN